VNRLALEEAEGVNDLIAAVDRVKAIQLGCGGGSGELASATAAHRAALDRLLARAGAMLQETDATATRQMLARVQTTLTAAAADAAVCASLREGRIERELAARGFDVFEGTPLPATAR